MSIRCDEFRLIYESVTMEALDPSCLFISEDTIRRYIESHPMPEDPAYSVDDFIRDITLSSGFYSLPRDIKPETADYIVDCLQELIV